MLKNMIAFLALTCLCGVALGLSPDYIYWKCENSGYLWQTDKTGQNPVQVRAAAWMGGFDSPLAAMTPDGAIIVEMIGQIWYAGIRKHDAASGSYVDMRLWGYDPEAGGSVGCDNNYIYFCCDYPGNVIDKFRISDGYHVSGTTIDRYSNYCFNLAVMNDTVWVGDGSGYLDGRRQPQRGTVPVHRRHVRYTAGHDLGRNVLLHCRLSQLPAGVQPRLEHPHRLHGGQRIALRHIADGGLGATTGAA
jgi:hypothetical protein